MPPTQSKYRGARILFLLACGSVFIVAVALRAPHLPIATSHNTEADAPRSHTRRPVIPARHAAPPSIPAPKQIRPVYKITPTPPTSGTTPEYSALIDECHRESEQILCSGKMTNHTDAQINLIKAASVNAVDDEGNQIRSTIAFSMGRNYATLIPGAPVAFAVTFDDPHQNAKAVTFQLWIYWRSYMIPDTLTYSRLPVQ